MKKKKSFEEAMKRLEEIVTLLEDGAQPLEQSLKLFEEGTSLAALCHTTLSEAKLKITELAADHEDDTQEEETADESIS